MITSTKNLEKYCKDYQNIENYAEAVKSPLKYDLHHRREITEKKSKKQLIAENLYYGRPQEELIFLEHGEHVRLHKANLSDETRKKMSDANKGEKNPMYGKNLSAETRKKMSDAKKGKPSPNRGKAGTCLGKHWHLENGHRVYTD